MTEAVQFKSFASPLHHVDIGGGDRFDWVRLKEDLGEELGHVYTNYGSDNAVNSVSYWLCTILFVASAVVGFIYAVVSLS